MGKPLMFKTPEILEAKINAYFDYCDNFEIDVPIYKKGVQVGTAKEKKPKKYTIAGLARWLDCDRRTLVDYTEREEYLPTLKRAKLRIEEQLEEALYGNSVTGIIFNLKNNYGWKDEKNLDHTTKGKEIGLVSAVQAKHILDAVDDSNPISN